LVFVGVGDASLVGTVVGGINAVSVGSGESVGVDSSIVGVGEFDGRGAIGKFRHKNIEPDMQTRMITAIPPSPNTVLITDC
jgi:hypothetical protein